MNRATLAALWVVASQGCAVTQAEVRMLTACVEVLPVLAEEEIDGYTVLAEVRAGSLERLKRDACAVGATAITAVQREATRAAGGSTRTLLTARAIVGGEARTSQAQKLVAEAEQKRDWPLTVPALAIRCRDNADPAGAMVVAVQSGGTADRVGVAPGDIIRRLDDTPTTTAEELSHAAAATDSDHELEIVRNGVSLTIDASGPHADFTLPSPQWYGWKILLADAASWAALIGAEAATDAGALVVGAPLLTLPGATIHWYHGHLGRGFLSIGLRAGLSFGGALVASSAKSGGSKLTNPYELLEAAVYGYVVGQLVAQLIDVAALGWEEPKEWVSAPALDDGGAASFAPSVGATPNGTLLLGLGGVF